MLEDSMFLVDLVGVSAATQWLNKQKGRVQVSLLFEAEISI